MRTQRQMSGSPDCQQQHLRLSTAAMPSAGLPNSCPLLSPFLQMQPGLLQISCQVAAFSRPISSAGTVTCLWLAVTPLPAGMTGGQGSLQKGLRPTRHHHLLLLLLLLVCSRPGQKQHLRRPRAARTASVCCWASSMQPVQPSNRGGQLP